LTREQIFFRVGRKLLKRGTLMKKFLFGTLTLLAITGTVWANGSPISEETETCLECHAMLHPGIVQE
jgi:hypothetical protein